MSEDHDKLIEVHTNVQTLLDGQLEIRGMAKQVVRNKTSITWIWRIMIIIIPTASALIAYLYKFLLTSGAH